MRSGSGSVVQGRASHTHVLGLIESSPALRQSYEALVSSLRLQNGVRPLNSLLISSAQPEEGKTTVAVGLALVLALAGKRVLLVDADLRRPALHRVFGVENARGLADVLAGDLDHAEAAHTIPIPDPAGGQPGALSLVTSGRPSSFPLGAMQSAVLTEVIHRFTEAYDSVVIDSPPLLSVSDALLIAPVVDGVILIVNTGVVSEADGRRAMERLSQAGGRVLGVVMNRFDERRHGPGFHPYHGYYESPTVKDRA